MEILLNDEFLKTNKKFLYEIIKEKYPNNFKDYILANVNGKIVDLNYKIFQDDKIDLIKKYTHIANLSYESTIALICMLAIEKIYKNKKVNIEYSVNNCLYLSVENFKILHKDIEKIKKEMENLIKEDFPIVKKTYKKTEALKIFKENDDLDKYNLLNSLDLNEINIYDVKDKFYFFTNYLCPKSSWIEDFDIIYYHPGILINYKKSENSKLLDFKEQINIPKIYERSKRWTNLLGIKFASDLNELVINDKIESLVNVNETYYNNQLNKCAKDIIANNMNIVMLAGPSSSGKTTTAKKLAIQLAVLGKDAYVISTDDYFVDRNKTPLDENGNKDFESIDAIDLHSLNEDLLDLLEGKEVILPSFNFIKGIRTLSNKKIKMKDNTILIIEGIHALNPKLTDYIPEKNKYKIYVSVLTGINIDSTNRISSTETRLIRRIVRDNKYRGYDTLETLKSWNKVKLGEQKYIFPYQNRADFYVDSSLIYEYNALKKYAIECFKQVSKNSKYYYMVDRLENILSYFVEIENTKIIDDHSILREFIGEDND
ncbi:nucleoside kinase [Anaerococcus vaginalis]|uniref:nucleoside kinase n=1 Tax=Anaerococcus vaginalis TaxID=33037 RepID=UPI002907BE26|nr:nucleoside kinase [Anaerococcus vaginalis]MDU4446862.1 nucleoside kinase [Anaerococcus vaginalis]MDU5252946.1 nucleoside kinase [Anaerococcus vaginalis]MDU6782117.1 nucleoside kinase [Anaerococcus vaginalis]MDU7432072.1 nucleoside kinase [Anaerococcus vaginalis]